DTAVDQRGIDADAFEAAEAEQVRDGLAHLQHRQRLPGDGRHHLRQHRLGRVAPFDGETDGSDSTPYEVADISARLGGSGTEDTKETNDTEDARPHQKTCLTRNSRA